VLVTRIIGKCPGCGTEQSYGNVNISQDILLRSCSRCNYSDELPLPPLSKVVLYLDQFFFSHAFRAVLPDFVAATQLISKLAHKQLIICPYSRTHEVETHQWRDPQRKKLFEFIKNVSRGHEFWPHYRIKKRQIICGFKRFLDSDTTYYPIEKSDALPDDINQWEDYFRIEVSRPPDNVERIRETKERAIEQLVDLFPGWRSDMTSFKEDQAIELADSRDAYVRLYSEMIERFAQGDFIASIDSPIDAQIVQSMLYFDEGSMEITDRMKRICEFFRSHYFAEVPYEAISTGLLAVLKKRVKQGHYQNLEKTKQRLSGFFNDVEFIAAYAPYCDAMVLDNAMMDFVNDSDLRLSQRYGPRFFSRNNWAEFTEYLHAVESKKPKALEWALRAVHP